MESLDKKNNIVLYVIMLLAIFSSGNLAFFNLLGGIKIIFPMLNIIFFVVLMSKVGRSTISPKMLNILGLFFILELIHFFLVDNSFISCLGMLTRLSCSLLLVAILAEDFFEIYYKIMYYLSIISLVFYCFIVSHTINYINPLINIASFSSVNSTNRTVTFIHTFFKGNSYYRNAGCFWEPGAFAGYLILALLFLVAKYRSESFHIYKKYFIVLSIALLTTLSTTGYIAFAVLVFYLIKGKISKKNYMIIISLMVGIFISAYFSYQKFDFLSDKINHQFEYTYSRQGNWQITRFGAFIHDYEMWQQQPLLGWGSDPRIRYIDDDNAILSGKGNGFSEFSVRNGLYGIIILLWAIFALGRHSNNQEYQLALLYSLIIMIVLQGEMFLGYPIYLSIFFLATLNFDSTYQLIENK